MFLRGEGQLNAQERGPSNASRVTDCYVCPLCLPGAKGSTQKSALLATVHLARLHRKAPLDLWRADPGVAGRYVLKRFRSATATELGRWDTWWGSRLAEEAARRRQPKESSSPIPSVLSALQQPSSQTIGTVMSNIHPMQLGVRAAVPTVVVTRCDGVVKGGLLPHSGLLAAGNGYLNYTHTSTTSPRSPCRRSVPKAWQHR